MDNRVDETGAVDFIEPGPSRGTLAVTDLNVDQLAEELRGLGTPAYRAKQLFRGVHRRHARSWSELTDLPAALRSELPLHLRLAALDLATVQQSSDGTVKLLLHTADRQAIETVHIPSHPGAAKRAPVVARSPRQAAGRVRAAPAASTAPDDERLTVCVSSQAGCALACGFCATGQMGYGRNLTIGEIVEQVYWAEDTKTAARQVDNVVFMGMGEPLLNYANVVGAIRLLADPEGYGFSPRRVTVSTSGIVPGMLRLANEGLDVRLAVSLHAPDDDLRSQLMPINRKFGLGEVLRAATHYAEQSGRRVSFEYVMLEDINDSPAQAIHLAQLVRDLRAHVNLIPYNQTFAGYRPSSPERIRAFATELQMRSIACTIRASRGRDIAAACGQLKVEATGRRPTLPMAPGHVASEQEKYQTLLPAFPYHPA